MTSLEPENTKCLQEWFDTPYYHLLYRDRDHGEASAFISHLASSLELKPGQRVLDLACGRGRHALELHRLGLHVTGADLSSEAIRYASQFSSERLHFRIHDMRYPLEDKFDAVLNLFTSFGSSDKEEDQYAILNTIKSALKPGGYAVIDYLNPEYTLKNLVCENALERDGIIFHCKRWQEQNNLYKSIRVIDTGNTHTFLEKVPLLDLEKFSSLFQQTGLKLISTFGNYELQPYQAALSERLIMKIQA